MERKHVLQGNVALGQRLGGEWLGGMVGGLGVGVVGTGAAQQLIMKKEAMNDSVSAIRMR